MSLNFPIKKSSSGLSDEPNSDNDFNEAINQTSTKNIQPYKVGIRPGKTKQYTSCIDHFYKI